MSAEQNILENVATWQNAEMAWMLNSFVTMEIGNRMFANFQELTANLGTTVTFKLTPRVSTQAGLVTATQQIVQRPQTLTVTQSGNVSVPMSAFQQIYNSLDEYMKLQGQASGMALGTLIESDVLKQCINEVRILDPQNPNNGQVVNTQSGPYRFYGDGTTSLNSFQQLAQIVARFEDYGAAMANPCGILPITIIPDLTANQGSKFTPSVNDGYFRNWDLGSFPKPGVKWYTSNLLPTHYSGTVGNEAQTLTLVSTNDPTGNAITQLTFSGATDNDPNAIVYGDRFSFNWGVSGQNNLYFTKFIGQNIPSQQPVQFWATAPAAATSAGHVTVNISPTLQSTPGQFQNLSSSLQPGMQVFVPPSHKAGVFMSGNALYLATPKLFDNSPYKTFIASDKESGMSYRNYYGAAGLGTNIQQYVWDCIWGSTLVPENSMAILIPITQGS